VYLVKDSSPLEVGNFHFENFIEWKLPMLTSLLNLKVENYSLKKWFSDLTLKMERIKIL